MNNNKDKYKEILRNLINTVLILGIIIALAFGGYLFYKNQKEKNGDDTKLSYTDLVKEIEAGNVEKIEMTTGSATLKVKLKDVEEEKEAIVPNTQAFIELIQDQKLKGNEIELIQKQQNMFYTTFQYLF